MAIALITPPPLEEALKTIRSAKSWFPKLGTVKLPTNAIVAIGALAEFTEDRMKNNIKNRTKQRRKRDKENQQVIKVADACDCVEDFFKDPKNVFDIGQMIAKMATDPLSVASTSLGEPICDCIERDALRQDTHRALIQKREKFHHRPSVGHGKGRVF